MAKKKAYNENVKHYLIEPDGMPHLIIGEDGVYWYCEGTQFFKRLGYKVVEREVEEEAVEEEK